MKVHSLPNRHTDKQRDTHRVAARLEGVVKNRGIKAHKKLPKLRVVNA